MVCCSEATGRLELDLATRCLYWSHPTHREGVATTHHVSLVLNLYHGQIFLGGCHPLLHALRLLIFLVVCASQLYQLGHQSPVLVLNKPEVIFHVEVRPLIYVTIKQHLETFQLICLRRLRVQHFHFILFLDDPHLVS